ncbi:MAG: hypothetical protein JO111_16975 [Caulobacteraceae bacterium]|nr:hypothetical protein [Caulobacteraceae bacterium]
MSERPVMSRATALAVVLVGVFAFAAFAVLIPYEPDLRQGDNGGAHALSRSAVGFAGLAKGLRLAGDVVTINRAPLRGNHPSGLLIITPGVSADRNEVLPLANEFGGPTLVILPKWLTAPDPRHIGWVRRMAPVTDPVPTGQSFLVANVRRHSGTASTVLTASGAPFSSGETFPTGAINRLQTFHGGSWLPVLTDQAGNPILVKDTQRELYVLSDPDLMNNQGLRDGRAFASAMEILGVLRSGDGPVIFDVRLNGLGRERSVLRLLFDPPFVAVTLCLAAAATLAGWQAFCRFGPARRPERALALGKAALIDNSAAMIRMAGREARMGGPYADLTAELAAKATGAPNELTDEDLDRMASQRGASERLADLRNAARDARSLPEMLSAAGRLRRWRLALTGEDA